MVFVAEEIDSAGYFISSLTLLQLTVDPRF